MKDLVLTFMSLQPLPCLAVQPVLVSIAFYLIVFCAGIVEVSVSTRSKNSLSLSLNSYVWQMIF